VKLFVKRNEKTTFAFGLALLSILTLSILSFPIFKLVAQAQDENQTSSTTAHHLDNKSIIAMWLSTVQ
jgi:hypothetical protein